jgi:competence protein ComEA
MVKSEKILIGIALAMMAMTISYNLFFEPALPEIVFNEDEIIKESELNQESQSEEFDYRVNINSASAQDLSEKLNGIGPVLAKRIVEYRESNGGFSEIEEIKNVKGIGNKLFEKIKKDIIL